MDLAVTFSTAFFATDFDFETADFAADEVFLAVDLVADLAFSAADFDFEAADLAADVDFSAEVFAADLTLEVAFLAVLDALFAVLAAALILVAIAALRPASWSFLEPAEATLETVSIFADTNFFAVAAPSPGSAVNFSIFESPFAVIGSLNLPYSARFFNTSPDTVAIRRWIHGP